MREGEIPESEKNYIIASSVRPNHLEIDHQLGSLIYCSCCSHVKTMASRMQEADYIALNKQSSIDRFPSQPVIKEMINPA